MLARVLSYFYSSFIPSGLETMQVLNKLRNIPENIFIRNKQVRGIEQDVAARVLIRSLLQFRLLSHNYYKNLQDICRFFKAIFSVHLFSVCVNLPKQNRRTI